MGDAVEDEGVEGLVVAVHVLIDAVLLDHEDLGTHPKEFVQFVYSQFPEAFPVQFQIYAVPSKRSFPAPISK